MCAPLRKVLVRRPTEAFGDADPQLWHYTARPDLEVAQQEHDALVALLRAARVEVLLHDAPMAGMADAIYVFDPVLMTDHGAVVLRMGKERRRGEEDALARRLARAGVPLLGRLEAPAQAEGGDLLWLDRSTLAVGVGRRTNRRGFAQLNAILSQLGITLIRVDVPESSEPASCLHLLSFISLVAPDLAVVYPPLLPRELRERLVQVGMGFIEVEQDEYEKMATNVLALAPRECVMLEGNPTTQRKLESAGCHVAMFKGDELCHKAEGGPTCLTLPILRAV
jgi:N-dimethylarginine dimethylaminohydrolase